MKLYYLLAMILAFILLVQAPPRNLIYGTMSTLLYRLMLLSFILSLAFSLSGCAAQIRYVPMNCPVTAPPKEPIYPIEQLKKGDEPSTVINAYVATVLGKDRYIQNQLLPRLKYYKQCGDNYL